MAPKKRVSNIFTSATRKSLTVVLGACAATLLAVPSYSYVKSFDKVSFAKSDKPLSSYEAVYIAPVETEIDNERVATRVSSRSGRVNRRVSEREQERKAEDLYEDLTRSIGKRFELADQPGPNILTVNTVINELRSTRPTFQDLSDNIGLSASSIYAGGATATFVLSHEGQEIATLYDRYSSSFRDGTPRTAIWADTDTAFLRWSKNLAKFIQKN